MRSETVRHVHVAIAGSGFGGLGTAIRLKQTGEDDFLVFEREGRVGGVWRDNSYPGCACDVPSHLYSFSFAQNPSWSRSYSPAAEIWAYLEACADRFGIVPHVRFHHTIKDATWDEEAQRWRLETTGGLYTADVFVAAVGGLSEPRLPDIPGLRSFSGKMFHSARWDHKYRLRDKRVAVIGTGASAIQFVPRIQPDVDKLLLFQRTPAWVVPRGDKAIAGWKQRILQTSPGLHTLLRGSIYGTHELGALMLMNPRIAKMVQLLAARHLRQSVKDPALRRKLKPSFILGCKRILLSDDYYPAVQGPNVEVITEKIERVTETAVVTADGVEHPVDAIVLGTGFRIQDYPFGEHIHGRGGQRLAERWRTTMTAHLGTTCVGFPNLFLLQGPNTALGHTSVIVMIEAQIDHILNALKFMKSSGATSVEPRPEAQAAFVEDVDTRMQGTVWTAGGCSSWYLDRQGRNSTLWPGFTFMFRRRVAPFRPSEYIAAHGDPVSREPRGSVLAYNFGKAMMALPSRLQVGLSGGSPIRRDGHALDPGLQFLLALERRMGGVTKADPAAVRKKHNREVVRVSGPKTPVHFTRDFSIPGPSGPLRVRHYATAAPHAPLLVFFHGGGYVCGNLETHDAGCRLLCRHGAMHVLAVDYRLAPEHPFPAPIHDGQAAFRWAVKHAVSLGADPRRVGVGGDSAGGNLGAVVSLLAREADGPMPTCQVLIYPSVDRTRAHPSIDTLAEGFMLTRASIEWYHAQYAGAVGVDSRDPRISPLVAPDKSRLPSAYVAVAAFDPLRDEGEAYAAALRSAGTPVVLRRFDSMIHGFFNMTSIHRPSLDAVIEIAGSARALFEGESKPAAA